MTTALAVLAAVAATNAAVINTADGLSVSVYDRAEVGRGFAMTATLIRASSIQDGMRYNVADSSGAVIVETKNFARFLPEPVLGDMLCVSGFIDFGRNSLREYAHCTNIAVISHGPPPKPVETTCAKLLTGEFDFQLVKITAHVRDVVHDDIDPKFAFVVLAGEQATIPMDIAPDRLLKIFGETSPIGAKLEVVGICTASPLAGRRQFGRLLTPSGPDTIRIVEPPPSDPFDAPELGEFRRLQPEQIASLGRHRVTGTVVAVERRRMLIVRTDADKIHNVMLASDNPPPCGARITAVGFPTTDLYRINLAHAIWRHEPGDAAPYADAAHLIDMRRILYDASGRRKIDSRRHGRAIRLAGTVRALRFADGESDLNVECDGHLVDVDVSACPSALDGLEPGCKVEVSGVCAVETEKWSPETVFPCITGITLVMRGPKDIRVTARPPWWTPGRLLAAIGVLLAAIVGILAWNMMLRRVSERRGRELAAEQVAHVESKLKVYERTRLAVELHDALSQNLAGISFEIDAAERLSLTDGNGAQRHLAVASRSLDSCRAELKNCIWDLRSNALEDADMDTAIRRTLAPHVDDGVLSVRFNVPRESFTDATAHAVLCIIRELVLNAIRHGGATRVLVAGSIEGGRLLFSVRDNGSGFDPESAPGPREGHNGLLGIRERVESFNGEFNMESTLGKGTKATVSIWTKSES